MTSNKYISQILFRRCITLYKPMKLKWDRILLTISKCQKTDLKQGWQWAVRADSSTVCRAHSRAEADHLVGIRV